MLSELVLPTEACSSLSREYANAEKLENIVVENSFPAPIQDGATNSPQHAEYQVEGTHHVPRNITPPTTFDHTQAQVITEISDTSAGALHQSIDSEDEATNYQYSNTKGDQLESQKNPITLLNPSPTKKNEADVAHSRTSQPPSMPRNQSTGSMKVPLVQERQDSRDYSPLTFDLNTQAALAAAQKVVLERGTSPAQSRQAFATPFFKFREMARDVLNSVTWNSEDTSRALDPLLTRRNSIIPEPTVPKSDDLITPRLVSIANNTGYIEGDGMVPSHSRPTFFEMENRSTFAYSQPQRKKLSLEAFSQTSATPSLSSTTIHVPSFVYPSTRSSDPVVGFTTHSSHQMGQRMFSSVAEDSPHELDMDATLDQFSAFLKVEPSQTQASQPQTSQS